MARSRWLLRIGESLSQHRRTGYRHDLDIQSSQLRQFTLADLAAVSTGFPCFSLWKHFSMYLHVMIPMPGPLCTTSSISCGLQERSFESSIWLESWTEIDIDIWTYLSWLEASYAPGGSGMACKYIGGYTKVSWVTLSLLLPGFFGRYWYCKNFPKLLSLGRSINHRADHGAKSHDASVVTF